MLILGLETSCDETAAAVVKGTRTDGRDKLLACSNIISSQIEIHRAFGGVVPEVAAREHVKNILPVIGQALEQAGLDPQAPRGLDAIAVTIGPGLITSLLIGVETARTLSFAWDVPLVAVNHIAGHINANFLEPPVAADPQAARHRPNNIFPALALTVSGGHTLLVLMAGYGDYKILGETLDDAAGEAFDKAASLLKLGYPGGPAIAKSAALWRKKEIRPSSKNQDKRKSPSNAVILPRPMLGKNNYHFSFSGLKTALLYALQKDKHWRKRTAEYSHAFEEAVTDVLTAKTVKAARESRAKTILLAGGVSANARLREKLLALATERCPAVPVLMADLAYTTDNAAMIAAAAYFQARRQDFTDWPNLKAEADAEL